MCIRDSITDRDQIIAVAGGAKKELLQRNISRQLEQAINERNTVMAARDDKAFIQLVDEELEGISAQVVAPIICEGDAIGAVALMSREARAKFGDMEMKLAVTAAGLDVYKRQGEPCGSHGHSSPALHHHRIPGLG